MLVLLESVAASNLAVHEAVRRAILAGYLAESSRDGLVPRFLLNDVVRYWRTIGVDFAGKQRRRRGEGWGLRNAKLRTSRKVLFAGGLLPVFRCQGLSREEQHAFSSTSSACHQQIGSLTPFSPMTRSISGPKPSVPMTRSS